MLNLKEKREVFKWFRRFSTVDIFPEQVDVQAWKVWPSNSTKLRSWASKAWYSLFVVHSLFKVLGLLHALLFLRGVPLHQVIIHGVLASTAMDYVLWYYVLYIKYADENAALIRMTLTGIIGGGKSLRARDGLIGNEMSTDTFCLQRATLHKSWDQAVSKGISVYSNTLCKT